MARNSMETLRTMFGPSGVVYVAFFLKYLSSVDLKTLIMATRLSVYDRTRIAPRMKVWQSPVMVERCWTMVKGRNAALDYKTIKRLHVNLIRTGSVTQQKGAGLSKTVITKARILGTCVSCA
ncbi:hypothetical protein ANN_14283 [Periplaneta americana]|uniref:Uncharacterized protein n=1 Tax=Periplaneta americana TaxID=6978 RepID=A0ABQ8SVX2_PERAM|nr:hypothetical protein ANN_14283 [Periplaneta americana]